MLIHLIVEEIAIAAGELRSNFALTVDQEHKRNERPHHGAELHVTERRHVVRRPDRERRVELTNESGDIGVGIDRRLDYFQSSRRQVFVNATQNLSGFLAVRSSGEDEDQAQDLASILAHQKLLATLQLHDELGRFPRKVGSGEHPRYQGQSNEKFCAHETTSILNPAGLTRRR